MCLYRFRYANGSLPQCALNPPPVPTIIGDCLADLQWAKTNLSENVLQAEARALQYL